MKILLIGYENDYKYLVNLRTKLEFRHAVMCMDSSISAATIFRKRYEQLRFVTLDHGSYDFGAASKHSFGAYDSLITRLEKWQQRLGSKISFESLSRHSCILHQYHHPRADYYNQPSSSLERYAYALHLLDQYDNIINSFAPDIVYSISNYEFIKSAASRLSKHYGYKSIIMDSSRIEEYWLLSFDGTLETCEQPTSSDHAHAAEIVQSYSQHNLSGSTYLDNLISASKASQFYLTDLAKGLLITCRNLIRHIFWSFSRVQDWFRPFHTNPFTVAIYSWRFYVNKIVASSTLEKIYKLNRSIYDYTQHEENFILYCLHYSPESSTLSQSPVQDEFFVITYIAERLPPGFFLLVKEHLPMIGFRDPIFYKRLNELPNIVLVDHKIKSRNLLVKSKGVIGLAGTILLEASLSHIPVAAVGNPHFHKLIPSPYRNGFTGIDTFLADHRDGKDLLLTNYDRSLEYITAIISQKLIVNIEDLRFILEGYGRPTQSIESLSLRVVELIESAINHD
jgi:hypothetical protein